MFRSVTRYFSKKTLPKAVILFFGQPGAGKGTYAGMLAKDTGLSIISMGDEMRKIVSGESAYDGDREALMKTINSGQLVSDDLSENFRE